jgi:environmental stress-induced protein Ves
MTWSTARHVRAPAAPLPPRKDRALIAFLEPGRYVRTPWKNGGGVSVEIASDGDVWRFGRTSIATPGAFSDYTGFDRMQVLVAGGGLVLETPDGEIDVRRPFRPVRFAGETPIVSRLEAGPVEVVNLMGDRSRVRIDLAVLAPGETWRLARGVHIAYCPPTPAGQGRSVLRLGEEEHELQADGGLRIEDAAGTTATCIAGLIVRASVARVLRQER